MRGVIPGPHPVGYIAAAVQGQAEPAAYHLWRLLNQSVNPAGPPVARWLWLWIALTAVWAARSSREPVWAGVSDANGYPADCPVAPPHLTGLISGSLRVVKASPALPEPAHPGAPPAAHAGAAPPQQPGMAAHPLRRARGPRRPHRPWAPRRRLTRCTTKARRWAAHRGDRCSPSSVMPRLLRKACVAYPTHHPRGVHMARALHRPSPSYRCTTPKRCP